MSFHHPPENVDVSMLSVRISCCPFCECKGKGVQGNSNKSKKRCQATKQEQTSIKTVDKQQTGDRALSLEPVTIYNIEMI